MSQHHPKLLATTEAFVTTEENNPSGVLVDGLGLAWAGGIEQIGAAVD